MASRNRARDSGIHRWTFSRWPEPVGETLRKPTWCQKWEGDLQDVLGPIFQNVLAVCFKSVTMESKWGILSAASTRLIQLWSDFLHCVFDSVFFYKS